jgi:hypothetical protein
MSFDWAKNPEWWSAIGTVIGSVVVVWSVRFLSAQLRETRRSIRSASAQQGYAMWLQVDQFFALNPKLKPFLYEDKSLEGLEVEDRRSAESATEMFSDCMANSFHQLEHFEKQDPQAAEAYRNFLKEKYQTQQALRQYIDEHARWYPVEFVALLKEEIKPVKEEIKPANQPPSA